MTDSVYIVLSAIGGLIDVEEIRTAAELAGKLAPDSHGLTAWGKSRQCGSFREWNEAADTADVLLVLQARVVPVGEVAKEEKPWWPV